MANTLNLWINAETGRLLSGSTSFVTAQTQTFYSGNSVDLELHLIAGAGVSRVPYEVPFPAGASIQVAVGTVATAPISGQWRLSVSSTETTDLAYNASASAVQTALNALSAVSSAGGVTVADLGGGYSITWNTVGTKPSILAGSDTLAPASYEAILVLQAGDVSTREIVFVELRQSPVALADSFAPIGTPVVSATTVSAWNGTNKIVRVGIDPAPKGGSFTITIGSKTAAVQAFASANDFNVALITAGVTTVSNLTSSGQLQYDIVLSADESVSVNGSGLITSPGVTGSLNLATSELIAYLGAEASKQASLEISVTAGGQTQTLVQVACNVANGVISSGAVAPVPVGVILTEAVANARFVRRDTAQSPSSADLDIIWPNLGVTLDGSDLAAALSAANAPASGNAIATLADIPPAPDLSAYLTIASAASTYQTLSGMSSYLTTSSAASTYLTISTAASTYALLSSFNQSLKTTDSVSFDGVTANSFFGPVNATGAGGSMVLDSSGLTFPDLTTQTTAAVTYDQSLNTTDSVYFEAVYGQSPIYGVFGLGLSSAATGLPYVRLADSSGNGTEMGPGGIIFSDATTQSTRVVRENQANGSAFTVGGFDTVHYPYEVKVIDDTGTAYWVPARLA